MRQTTRATPRSPGQGQQLAAHIGEQGHGTFAVRGLRSSRQYDAGAI